MFTKPQQLVYNCEINSYMLCSLLVWYNLPVLFGYLLYVMYLYLPVLPLHVQL